MIDLTFDPVSTAFLTFILALLWQIDRKLDRVMWKFHIGV